MFIANKYYFYYYSIIHSAQSRVQDPSVYYESHHILPKSLGGTNKKSNLVNLTPREHYICHLCLSKITHGIDKRKMTYAFRHFLGKDTQFKMSSRIFEILRTEFRNAMISIWQDPDYKASQISKYKKYWSDFSNREARSLKLKEVWNNKDLRTAASISSKKYWSDETNRRNQSVKLIKAHQNDPTLALKKSRPGKLNGMYGKTHTNEVKLAASQRATENFKGKSYELQFGKEKATALKNDKSEKLKLYNQNNPTARLKSYSITSPDGTIYNILGGLEKFCKDHGISSPKMYAVAKGRLDNFKGWHVTKS